MNIIYNLQYNQLQATQMIYRNASNKPTVRIQEELFEGGAFSKIYGICQDNYHLN